MEKANLPKLHLTARVFREGKTYVAHTPELDVASCGQTPTQARANLRDAVSGFMKSAYSLGTLKQILREAGFTYQHHRWSPPKLVSSRRLLVGV